MSDMHQPAPTAQSRSLRVLGVIVGILGILTVTVGINDHIANVRQNDCFQRSFSQLSTVLIKRAEVADQRNQLVNAQTKLLNDGQTIQSLLILTVSQAKTQAQVRQAFTTFRHQNARLSERQSNLSTRIDKVTEQQAKTKVPPFPGGKCN